jgi:hypothetical protein
MFLECHPINGAKTEFRLANLEEESSINLFQTSPDPMPGILPGCFRLGLFDGGEGREGQGPA